jgi:diamine N-acetyltransferase
MFSIINADASCIPVIKQLAHLTWPVTYQNIISAAQINYMLQLFYDEAALQNQMEQGHQFILAIKNGEAIGFASYSPKENDPVIYRLHKLYIHPDQQ